jgi:hypothetical protein
VVAGVGFAGFRMKKKPSAPLLRPTYIHLLASFEGYRLQFDRVTAVSLEINEICGVGEKIYTQASRLRNTSTCPSTSTRDGRHESRYVIRCME